METQQLHHVLGVAKALMEQHKSSPSTTDAIFSFIDWMHDFVFKNYSERVLYIQYAAAERTDLYSRTSRFRKILMTIKRCADLQIEMNAIFRSPGWGVAVYSNSAGHFTKSVRQDSYFQYNLSMVCPEDLRLSTNLETANVLPFTKSSPIPLPDMELNMRTVPISKGRQESPMTIPGTPVSASPVFWMQTPISGHFSPLVPSSASIVARDSQMPFRPVSQYLFSSMGTPENLSVQKSNDPVTIDLLWIIWIRRQTVL